MQKYKIAVVIPCYRVKKYILGVVEEIGEEVQKIYVIDDCCPENSGDFVKNNCKDKRVTIIKNNINQGVGGAVIAGYKAALLDDMDIIVKIDGDAQMDPKIIGRFIRPIISGQADYTKGNRFFRLEGIYNMPKIRIFGNAVLSFMSKLSTGYWNIFDPTNGYTAIHRDALSYIPMEKLSKRYFFETDMLFRLNTFMAVVTDIPMNSYYGNERSNLKIRMILFEFLFKHASNFIKRIFYNYYLRNMSLASLELPLGVLLTLFGIYYGCSEWRNSIQTGIVRTSGTVMLSSLPIILGLQFILSFFAFDISNTPKTPIHTMSYFQEQ